MYWNGWTMPAAVKMLYAFEGVIVIGRSTARTPTGGAAA